MMSTLTPLFLCQGKPVGQIVGFVSKEDLERGLGGKRGSHQQCLGEGTELRPHILCDDDKRGVYRLGHLFAHGESSFVHILWINS